MAGVALYPEHIENDRPVKSPPLRDGWVVIVTSPFRLSPIAALILIALLIGFRLGLRGIELAGRHLGPDKQARVVHRDAHLLPGPESLIAPRGGVPALGIRERLAAPGQERQAFAD